MNKVLKIFAFVLILVFSLSIVSAENIELNTDDLNQETRLDESNQYDYSWLNKTIYENEPIIDLEGKKVSYNSSNDENFTNGIIIESNITIKNGIINGDNLNKIFYIPKYAFLTLDNITLENGNSIMGGAIHLFEGNLTIRNSFLINNNATYGGAIYAEYGNLIIDNVTFNNNSAYQEGGAIYSKESNIIINNSIFSSNIAEDNAGAIGNNNGILKVYNSIFNNNHGRVGIIDNWGGNTTITSSGFYNNIADTHAGAIYSTANNNLNVSYSVFYNNTASNGKDIYVKSNNADLSNNFWANNTPDFSLLIMNESSYILNDFIVINLLLDNNKTDIGGNILYRVKLLNNDTLEEIDGDLLAKITLNIGNLSDSFIAQDFIDNPRNLKTNSSGNFTLNLYYFDELLDSKKYEVMAINKVNLTSYDIEMIHLNGTQYIAYLKDLLGNAIVGELIFIEVNGVIYNRTTDSKGAVYLNINLDPKTYNVTSYYNGSKIYENASITTLLVVKPLIETKDLVKYYLNGTQFNAKINGELLNGTNITLSINGRSYNRTINDDGIATLNINLYPGNYTITTSYSGFNVTNKIEVLPTILTNDLVKYYLNETQFNAKILAGDGKPLNGTNVTFTVNTITYIKTTNDDGIAKLNINLYPGNYTITTRYNGWAVTNNIEVKSTLEAENLTKTFDTPDQFVAKVLDSQGNPLNATTVKIHINGIAYTKTSDENGLVKLNINLDPGSYIATTGFNGYYISNWVNVII
ncbi:hypothetical protein [Methanobrevibacter sp. DSM 116169]|uniref:Ig-like domain-containing protein n=1 Tax=Methanobrevibacter sp. DSM 116169 TaxID=3242727 RepID=UPI0038FD10A5